MQHNCGFAANKLLSTCRTLVGKTTRSTVLFLSSNPSIDESERYPDLTWTEDQTNDFFHNRFGVTAGWVRNGLNTLQKDGSFSRNWVRCWAAARSRAAELLEKERALNTRGLDFALTEAVHCKSRNEVGVKEAQEFRLNAISTESLRLGSKGDRGVRTIGERRGRESTEQIHAAAIRW